MPRPAKFEESDILDAAADIAASNGPAAATVAAIGQAIGAPSGSIYHRFSTRDQLLGRLWLNKARSFQTRWIDALGIVDPKEAGLAAALSLPQSVREDMKGARIMLLHRREDFLSDAWPSEMKREASRLKLEVDEGLAQIAVRLFKSKSVLARQAATFAVLDLPFSAVRRYVAFSEKPPLAVDRLIESAYKAIVSEHSKIRRAEATEVRRLV